MDCKVGDMFKDKIEADHFNIVCHDGRWTVARGMFTEVPARGYLSSPTYEERYVGEFIKNINQPFWLQLKEVDAGSDKGATDV